MDPKAGSLKTSIVVLNPDTLRDGDRPRFQVQVENVGATPVVVPISPAMEPLQPEDPAKDFTYYKATVTLWIGGDAWYANTAGGVDLFGDADHPGTTATLHPGEWIRISGRANIKLSTDDAAIKRLRAAGDKPNRLFARTVIYLESTTVTSTSTDIASQDTCVNQVEGPSRPMQFLER